MKNSFQLTTFCCVRSESTLFAQACLSQWCNHSIQKVSFRIFLYQNISSALSKQFHSVAPDKMGYSHNIFLYCRTEAKLTTDYVYLTFY